MFSKRIVLVAVVGFVMSIVSVVSFAACPRFSAGEYRDCGESQIVANNSVDAIKNSVDQVIKNNSKSATKAKLAGKELILA